MSLADQAKALAKTEAEHRQRKAERERKRRAQALTANAVAYFTERIGVGWEIEVLPETELVDVRGTGYLHEAVLLAVEGMLFAYAEWTNHGVWDKGMVFSKGVNDKGEQRWTRTDSLESLGLSLLALEGEAEAQRQAKAEIVAEMERPL